MKLATQAHADGLVVKVRAAPGASRERVVGLHADALKIAVQAPPEKGRANERIAAVLAAALGLPARDVELVSGPTSRDKRFLIRGHDRLDLEARLRALVPA